MNDVLDASAIIAYLRNEVGASVVESRLLDPSVTCYVHSINLCEVYYEFLRVAGSAAAESAIADLLALEWSNETTWILYFGDRLVNSKLVAAFHSQIAFAFPLRSY